MRSAKSLQYQEWTSISDRRYWGSNVLTVVVQPSMVWYGMIWFVVEWHRMVCYCIVWYGWWSRHWLTPSQSPQPLSVSGTPKVSSTPSNLGHWIPANLRHQVVDTRTPAAESAAPPNILTPLNLRHCKASGSHMVRHRQFVAGNFVFSSHLDPVARFWCSA